LLAIPATYGRIVDALTIADMHRDAGNALFGLKVINWSGESPTLLPSDVDQTTSVGLTGWLAAAVVFLNPAGARRTSLPAGGVRAILATITSRKNALAPLAQRPGIAVFYSA
jgi:hypothetical protein